MSVRLARVAAVTDLNKVAGGGWASEAGEVANVEGIFYAAPSDNVVEDDLVLLMFLLLL